MSSSSPVWKSKSKTSHPKHPKPYLKLSSSRRQKMVKIASMRCFQDGGSVEIAEARHTWRVSINEGRLLGGVPIMKMIVSWQPVPPFFLKLMAEVTFQASPFQESPRKLRSL